MMRELLDQIRMPQEIKKFTSGHCGIFLPIASPSFLDLNLLPGFQEFRTVKIPASKIVDRSDKIVPICFTSKFGDPLLAPGKPVALKAKANRNAVVRVIACLLYTSPSPRD